MQGLMQDVPLTLDMVLERVATIFPEKHVATLTADSVTRTTYGDLALRVTRLASALAAAGVRPGDRVATFAWNSQRHLELYLALPCMGAVLHTMNPRLHPEQVAWIARHAQDRFVFVDASLAETWGRVPAVESIEQVVVMDDLGADDVAGLPGAVAYEGFLASGRDAYRRPRLHEDQAAAMCYTSGTTGDPKGVVYSHRSSVLHMMMCLFSDTLGLRERDVLLPIVPQFHANAWGTPYASLYAGTTLAMPGRFMADPVHVARLVQTEGVTVSAAVPTVWFEVLQAMRRGDIDPAALASLERIVVGGSAVPEALVRAYDDIGIRMVHAWGMTETSPLGAIATVKSSVAEEDVPRTRLSQGLPNPSVRMRLITDSGEQAPWDGATPGELQVSGPWVARAYYDPSAPGNAGGLDRFADDAEGRRWLRTGDVAVIEPSGYLRLVDRTKDLIKSGGEWISSVELENLLMAHPGVAEAAVIAVPHRKWDERPLACVVPSDPDLTAQEVLDHLARHVAKWQVPDQVVFIEEVPKTSVGKFDKKVLRDRFSAHYAVDGGD